MGTTYLSAGHIKSEAAGWKSGRLHCSLPRSDKSSSRSRLCWLRNNIYFPSAALRGNIPLFPFLGNLPKITMFKKCIIYPFCYLFMSICRYPPIFCNIRGPRTVISEFGTMEHNWDKYLVPFQYFGIIFYFSAVSA